MKQNSIDVPFNATITFSRRSDSKFIANQTVTGIWQGVIGSSITSNIFQYS